MTTTRMTLYRLQNGWHTVRALSMLSVLAVCAVFFYAAQTVSSGRGIAPDAAFCLTEGTDAPYSSKGADCFVRGFSCFSAEALLPNSRDNDPYQSFLDLFSVRLFPRPDPARQTPSLRVETVAETLLLSRLRSPLRGVFARASHVLC